MSRARSKTVDSAEGKKKGLPWRLNEKIALMKEKEQEQSQAFEQAMQSIFEMQQARIHPGGGSMPSLQSIDANPPPPSNPFPMVMMDGGMCLTTPSVTTARDRPHSGGPSGRTSMIERTQSCDTSNNPSNCHPNTNQYWNIHKSDSDLQQSLLMEANQQPLHPPFPPSALLSPPSILTPPSSSQSSSSQHQQQPALKLSSDDPSHQWTNPRPAQNSIKLGSSVSAALLSPEYTANSSIPIDSMGGGASSLPDLTNVEFSCGLDIPIEDDESPNIKSTNTSFHYPPVTSKLAHSTMQAPPTSIPAPPNVTLVNTNASGMPHQFLPHLVSPPVLNSANSWTNQNPPVRKLKPIIPAGSASGNHGYHHHTYSQLPPDQYITLIHPQTSYQSINGMTPPTISLTSPPPILPPYSIPYVTTPTMSPPNPHSMAGEPMQYSAGNNPHRPPPQHFTLPPYLDPGLMYQKQVLQQKMAGMSFNAPPIRSHSEENLLTSGVNTYKSDDIQSNPFMGNMTNANSVPCVHVESGGNMEPCVDTVVDSPTTGSPSTSPSRASSPIMTRPSWFDQSHSMNDYMFREWPMDSGGVMGGEKLKLGSPLSHHKSLTELNKLPIDYMTELSPNSQSRAHQLSLPSIVMNDLMTIEDSLDKHFDPHNGVFLPDDFEMEEEVMESLLRDDGFIPFDVNFIDNSFLHHPPQFNHSHRLNF